MKLMIRRVASLLGERFTFIRLIHVVVTIGCFTISQEIEALSPPPDGGYPGGNTAEGQNALLSLSTGIYNTGVGIFSLESNSDGKFNTATGAGTLLLNTADENTATGAGALLSNTTGGPNTANGAFALFANTTGNNNNAVGFEALFSNTTGPFNNAFGNGALASNTTGDRNTAIGEGALLSNTTGAHNIALGVSALRNNSTGNDNVAIGQDACSQSQGGQFNTAVGSNSLIFNTADSNTAIGGLALSSNTAGQANTGVGGTALFNNTTGIRNTAVGASALASNTTGSNNIAIGFNAGAAIDGDDNIDIGTDGSNGESHTIRIGHLSHTKCFIAGIAGATVPGGVAVIVDGNGQLGTSTSSARFKEQVKPMDKTSEGLLALKPVTFRYKKEIDPQGIPQFGLVAEEVEKVNSALVVHDNEGKPYTVRYDQVNAMLLNEFLKEHKAFGEQEQKVQKLETTVASLTARLKEQAAQIQKVSAKVDASRPASRVAMADP
jgi:Chaperone of endosialidase